MSLLDMLQHRCTIQTYVATTTDGAGKPSGTWTETYTGVPCKLQGAGKGVENVVRVETVNADFVLFLQASTTISERDRVSSRLTREGVSVYGDETFHVISVRPVGVHHKVAYLELVR